MHGFLSQAPSSKVPKDKERDKGPIILVSAHIMVGSL